MIFHVKLAVFSLIIFCFNQAFGEKRIDCSSNVTYDGFADIVGQIPDYFVDFIFMTESGEQTLSYNPCKKGKWDPDNLTWCEGGSKAQIMNLIKQIQVAPGIYAYEVKFFLRPENTTIDPFCNRASNSIVITDYVKQQDSKSFLVSAYKSEVLGLLYVSLNDRDASIVFFQGPCSDWNTLINSTMYQGQGLYPDCAHYTK